MANQATARERGLPPTGVPAWVWELLGVEPASEGETFVVRDRTFVVSRGVLRAAETNMSQDQSQTSETFGFKWAKRDTFESDVSLRKAAKWLLAKYGDIPGAPWWDDYGPAATILDAGCGAGMSALALLAPVLQRTRYLGVDVSSAVDVARTRFAEHGLAAGFMQCDLMNLPLEERSVDAIFSEGVLHHTDSTEAALRALAPLLKPGGRFMFYVYRRKGPIREFTDDYIRDKLQALEPSEAWEAVKPLTELGRTLGDLDVEVDIPSDISLLEIPAGRTTLQRLFYWHVAKAFYDPDMTLDELNHINFDWYAPRNAHRQSADEVRSWCADLHLEIEHEDVQEAGITIVARRSD